MDLLSCRKCFQTITTNQISRRGVGRYGLLFSKLNILAICIFFSFCYLLGNDYVQLPTIHELHIGRLYTSRFPAQQKTSNPSEKWVDPKRVINILHLGKPHGAIAFTNYKRACPLKFECLHHAFNQSNWDHFETFDVIDAPTHSAHKLLELWRRSGKPRNPWQLWLTGGSESVLNSVLPSHLADGINGMFNWSSYMSPNATFDLAYFSIEKKSDLKFEAVKEKYYSLNKSKAFCWAISNCGMTWTNRNDLGMELIRNLPEKTHMWGNAADNCFHPVENFTLDHGSILGPELKRELSTCKFYMAFENSNCSGYITEKFMNALNAYAVPIVNGWWDSYTKKLPGSFIHVSQFGSGKELGEYLAELLSDEVKYLEYHKWRTEYTAYYHDINNIRKECMVCQKAAEVVATFNTSHPEISIIPDFRDLYKSGKLSTCNRSSRWPSHS